MAAMAAAQAGQVGQPQAPKVGDAKGVGNLNMENI